MGITTIILSYPSVGVSIVSTLLFIFFRRKYYFIYNHRLLFVVGLVFSRSLAYYTIVDMLMWYFTDHDVLLLKSTVLSNIQESLSSLFVIFMAHSADSVVGRFRTLVFSTTAYICGIMILLMFNPYDVTWFVVITLVLLALGKSGDIQLEYVLTDLVDEIDMSADRNRKRSHARATTWWRIAHVSGAVSAIMWVAPEALGGTNVTWNGSFLICFITMTATLMIFCSGHSIYHQAELTHRPVEIFLRVIRTRIQQLRKSKSRCSTNASTQETSLERKPETEGATPERSPLHLDTIDQQSDPGISSYKEDVKVIASLLRMFPMWATFFVVSLTSAVGSTFYIEQYTFLENKLNIPAQIYILIQDFSCFGIPFLYHWTCFRQNQKLKIGFGMLCSIISCVFAWQLEVHRQSEVSTKLVGNEDPATSISFLRLVPQFFMLGCMEGLTQDGLLKFFKTQVDEPVKNYGEEYMEIVMCLGKLVNIGLMLIIKIQLQWFDGKKYHTHLDDYYRLLVCICSINLIIYCCVAICFYKNTNQDHNSAHSDLQRHN